tara:strand:- start:3069 stop:3278 length:210 start_codon:yes stop_codon:yes gene_type:complete
MPFNFKNSEAYNPYRDTKVWHEMCDQLILLSSQDKELKKGLQFLDKKYGKNGKVSMYEILYSVVFQFRE